MCIQNGCVIFDLTKFVSRVKYSKGKCNRWSSIDAKSNAFTQSGGELVPKNRNKDFIRVSIP